MYHKLPFQSDILCNVYHDGSHLVARRVYKSSVQSLRIGALDKQKELDSVFEAFYFDGVEKGFKSTKRECSLNKYIEDGILERLQQIDEGKFIDVESYVTKKIGDKKRNLAARKKRFERKAYLNKWNYFATFTYDDKKFARPEDFVKTIKKCLANFHTRRGWRYMGVFERAPETGRVHLHVLLYVPEGQMVGDIIEVHDYNTTKHKMQTAHVNTFFGERFGRADFVELAQGSNPALINYILKYITKTDDKIFYSRGIPSEVCMKISIDDIVVETDDYYPRFVLFDDVFERYKERRSHRRVVYEEQDFFELLAS